jgi:hypothetical protein
VAAQRRTSGVLPPDFPDPPLPARIIDDDEDMLEEGVSGARAELCERAESLKRELDRTKSFLAQLTPDSSAYVRASLEQDAETIGHKLAELSKDEPPPPNPTGSLIDDQKVHKRCWRQLETAVANTKRCKEKFEQLRAKLCDAEALQRAAEDEEVEAKAEYHSIASKMAQNAAPAPAADDEGEEINCDQLTSAFKAEILTMQAQYQEQMAKFASIINATVTDAQQKSSVLAQAKSDNFTDHLNQRAEAAAEFVKTNKPKLKDRASGKGG